MNTRPFQVIANRVYREDPDDDDIYYYSGRHPWAYRVSLEFWGLPVPMAFEDPYTEEITFELALGDVYCDDDSDVEIIERVAKRLNRIVRSIGIYNFLREYMRRLRRIHGIFRTFYRETLARLQTVLDEMKRQRSKMLATVARERFRVARGFASRLSKKTE